ncbi:hypothetical protein TNCV_4720831 [Trichonephila clavipes]|uniref:Uncharacterized protein n=1 Tax=Trichonephila clavipes TaxID=2585209 RepID=A0A8X6W633_TRICX|nr:hypothetical protein TNCV_4720831 [Trichonephila clavipes]
MALSFCHLKRYHEEEYGFLSLVTKHELILLYPKASFRFRVKIVKVEIGGVGICHRFGDFRRANSYCHLYGGQRQAYFYPLATMNFVGLDLTTSDRWH